MALLTELALQYNQLGIIHEEIFDPTNRPNALDTLKIFSNPLVCGNDLKWLKQADTTWITVYSPGSTRCTQPAELYWVKWSDLELDDMYYIGLY